MMNKAGKLGESRPGLMGKYENYDASGKKVGESRPGLHGKMQHYDINGRLIGTTLPDWLGRYAHYDASGQKIVESGPEILRTRRAEGDAGRPVNMPFGPDHSGKHGC